MRRQFGNSHQWSRWRRPALSSWLFEISSAAQVLSILFRRNSGFNPEWRLNLSFYTRFKYFQNGAIQDKTEGQISKWGYNYKRKKTWYRAATFAERDVLVTGFVDTDESWCNRRLTTADVSKYTAVMKASRLFSTLTTITLQSPSYNGCLSVRCTKLRGKSIFSVCVCVCWGGYRAVRGYRKAPGFARGSLIFLYLWVSQTPSIWGERKKKKLSVFWIYVQIHPSSTWISRSAGISLRVPHFLSTTFHRPRWSWRRVRCRPRSAAPLPCTSEWCWRTWCRTVDLCLGSISGGRGTEGGHRVNTRAEAKSRHHVNLRWFTHSGTCAVDVHGGVAAAVQSFLHVVLSGLRLVPAGFQQAVL